MRCKKHTTDVSSSVGVCASCLRERLFALISAQTQYQAQWAQEGIQKSDTNPPPLVFPRSVSPYISRRKSDTATVETATWNHHQQCRQSNLSLPDEKFFSTPQVGPNGAIVVDYKKKKKSRFSLLSNMFRSKSEIPDMDSDPTRVSDSRESSSSSPSWFSVMILPGRRKKKIRTFSLDESAIKDHRRPRRKRDRGMSPEMYSDDEEENNEHCHAGSSGYSSESSQGWKQTPRRTPATATGRGGARPSHSRTVSGIAFCLSPLVRASPNRQWNQKGVPPEMVVPGDVRLPVKPHLSTASLFCKNRSRKLADFGRCNPNR